VNWFKVAGRGVSYEDMIGISQLFLLREAEMFKEWIDEVFPEENTEMVKVEYPLTDIVTYPFDYNEEEKHGSFWSNHIDWLYDLAVCYYIDINNVKVRAT